MKEPRRDTALDTIRIDGGTQPRAEIDQSAVDDYAEAMRAGAAFPPVVVFDDGVSHWLADGFHRYHAARLAGRKEIAADVRPGTLRDAILYSAGTNAAHGLRRTNEDKRRAVGILLADREWAQRSDRWIAERCGVSHTFVQAQRHQLATVASSPHRVGQDGKTRRLAGQVIGEGLIAPSSAPSSTPPTLMGHRLVHSCGAEELIDGP